MIVSLKQIAIPKGFIVYGYLFLLLTMGITARAETLPLSDDVLNEISAEGIQKEQKGDDLFKPNAKECENPPCLQGPMQHPILQVGGKRVMRSVPATYWVGRRLPRTLVGGLEWGLGFKARPEDR